MSTISIENIKDLPDTPGVYLFKDAQGTVLYIGKATSLRDRVRSYFSSDLERSRGPKITQMLSLSKKVSYIATDSVLEALLLEARLIRKRKPTYNTDLKDDKSFPFVIITKEEFPRVLTVRGRELLEGKVDPKTVKYSFGPFPHAGSLREALRIVRRIFPFRDKCAPCIEVLGGKCKPCFNAQLGLCPGVCTGVIDKQEYARTVRNIKLFFEGNKKDVVRNLERQMKDHAKKLEFEKANEVKKRLFALTHIRDVALLKHNSDDTESEHSDFRIEAYDIAHISGTSVVGVMTVVEGGETKKSDYRKFRIKSFQGSDDTRALREVLDRRLAHPEWPLPRLIVVDGGKAQKNMAERVLAEAGVKIPVVGVVKDHYHRPKNILGSRVLISKHERAILLVNGEAHRFAVEYHRKVRGKGMAG